MRLDRQPPGPLFEAGPPRWVLVIKKNPISGEKKLTVKFVSRHFYFPLRRDSNWFFQFFAQSLRIKLASCQSAWLRILLWENQLGCTYTRDLIGYRRGEKSPAPDGNWTHNLKSFAPQPCAQPLCHNRCPKVRFMEGQLFSLQDQDMKGLDLVGSHTHSVSFVQYSIKYFL